ncbi:MAG: hypothetical protein EOS12_05730 [Mesorhizobium sp.]|nr:MAG: hypothetical protein EOS12_05730 [Mesorhizobium sp.]
MSLGNELKKANEEHVAKVAVQGTALQAAAAKLAAEAKKKFEDAVAHLLADSFIRKLWQARLDSANSAVSEIFVHVQGRAAYLVKEVPGGGFSRLANAHTIELDVPFPEIISADFGAVAQPRIAQLAEEKVNTRVVSADGKSIVIRFHLKSS